MFKVELSQEEVRKAEEKIRKANNGFPWTVEGFILSYDYGTIFSLKCAITPNLVARGQSNSPKITDIYDITLVGSDVLDALFFLQKEFPARGGSDLSDSLVHAIALSGEESASQDQESGREIIETD